MLRAKIFPVIVTMSCGLSLQAVYGQPKSTLEYRDRGDRMEGIRSFWETGGADIDFWGAYIEGADFPSSDSIKSVQLKFYLPDSANLTIIVRDLRKKNYWMIPHQTQWPRQWNAFIWPGQEVLTKAPIQLYELIPRAMTMETPFQVVPVLLGNDGFWPRRQKYVFVFETSGKAEILVTWLQKVEKGYKKLESYTLTEPAETPFVVEREFKPSSASESEKEGIYRLQLRCEVDQDGNIETPEWEGDFYYKSSFK